LNVEFNRIIAADLPDYLYILDDKVFEENTDPIIADMSDPTYATSTVMDWAIFSPR